MRTRALIAAALAATVLAACGGGSSERAPSAAASAVTSTLKDALITSAVKAALIGEDPDSTTTVGVSTSGGVVTLSGTVRDAATRDRFVKKAGSAAGVVRVVDDVRVDPNAPRIREQVGDVALAARVQTALTAQLGLNTITVHVSRAVATLDGTVPDAKTKTTALATARGTSGVRNVVDHLRVAGP